MYIKMMQDAYDEWSTIENLTGQELYKQSGILFVSRYENDNESESLKEMIAQNNIKHEVLTKDEAIEQFPMLRYDDDANFFLLEHEAGFLKSDECLNAAQKLFKRFGGVLRDGEMVQNIVPGEIVQIRTQENLYTAKNVVITAGPWTSKLLKPLRVQLPIQPLRILVCYFREKIAGTYKMPQVPITLYRVQNRDIFTMPPIEYPNLTKVVYCDGPNVDPDNTDRNPDGSKEYLEKICNHVKDHLPGLEPIPSIIETCIFTFLLPSSRGSSHGKTRGTRKFDCDESYVKMMQDAYGEWSTIENLTGQELYKQSGMLLVSRCENENESESLKEMIAQNNIKHTVLTKDEAIEQFPMLRYDDDANFFLLEHEAGILKSDKCLNAAQELFKRFGGILRDGEMVQDIVPGEIVHIHTQVNLYTAKNVVITAGPWTSKLLKPLRVQLPIQPLRILVCYFREKIAGTYKMPHVPITLYKVQNRDMYTMPPFEYPNLTKVVYCDGPNMDPDNPERNSEASKKYLEKICNHVKDHFPGLEPIPSVIENCIYTMTPDGSFILDHHPQHRNIAIGAGFSGHGFKLAPVVGKLLKQLVTGEKPAHDMNAFSMQRFDKIPKSTL
ncbi:peroxisomal sarcosine oxidase-like isoform X2 [Tubulanus polymorphus]